jgi:hypothetical protein
VEHLSQDVTVQHAAYGDAFDGGRKAGDAARGFDESFAVMRSGAAEEGAVDVEEDECWRGGHCFYDSGRVVDVLLCYKQSVGGSFLAIALAICVTPLLFAQCPSSDPPASETVAQTLEGRLIFHDGIRQWFELKLDQPQCGQASIQLVRDDLDQKPLEVLRGCRIKSQGVLGFSATGYYSLDVYQYVEQIESVGKCVRQAPFPDFSSVKPDKSVREYRVEMHLIYRSGDHPIVFTVSEAGHSLRPWQVYASYWLTGGYVLYGRCGEGFVVDKVFGTPQASPAHFDEARSSDDMAMFDPESAAASGKKELDLGFTCVRP